MSNYKVGDLASLMSPSSTTKTSKLQHLFNEHWKRNPNAIKEAKIKKSKLKNSAMNGDTESSPNKKKKKLTSPMKKTKTDFNSDYLAIDSQEEGLKKADGNAEKKRKNSFPSNSAMKKKKMSAEQSNDVEAFIRCPEMKRQKTGKSADSTTLELNDSKEKLFNENMHESKKQKFKKNSKQNLKNFSNNNVNSDEEESSETIDIKPDSLPEKLFSETADTTSKLKKQKMKKKLNKFMRNNSDDTAALIDEGDDDEDSFGDSDGEDDESDSEKTKAGAQMADVFSDSDMEHSESDSKMSKTYAKKNKADAKKNKSDVKNISSADSDDTEESESDSEKNKGDAKRSKTDAKTFKLQNQKDLPFTLFVGNLPVSINRKKLRKIFAPFGQIKSARLRGAVSTKLSIPKKIAEIKNEYHKGLQSHTGFVIFKDKESAKDALSLNGTLIDNRHIVVDFASQAGEKRHYDSDLSVFVGNLPFDVDDETVRSAFEEYGEIHALRIIRDRDTGVGKGFGYIQFEESESRDKALSTKDIEINGRKIRVSPIKSADEGKKAGAKKTVMMIRNSVAAMKRIKESGNKKSVKKLLKKEKQIHKRKQVARLLGEKFVK